MPLPSLLNKGITSVENNRLIFKPRNCNFLPKLQSNDYRHEVELDNNTRERARRGEGEKNIAKDPGAPKESEVGGGGWGGGGRMPTKNESSPPPIGNRV